jgi:hypothetical protein
MKQVVDESRRRLLQDFALGLALIPIAATPLRAANTADSPVVAADDPVAKAVKYVGDASQAPNAKSGSRCANCSLYQGGVGSVEGGCLLFPGKSVKSAGWCSSWTIKP